MYYCFIKIIKKKCNGGMGRITEYIYIDADEVTAGSSQRRSTHTIECIIHMKAGVAIAARTKHCRRNEAVWAMFG